MPNELLLADITDLIKEYDIMAYPYKMPASGLAELIIAKAPPLIRAGVYKQIGDWLVERLKADIGNWQGFITIGELAQLRAGKSPTEESEK